MTVGSAGTTLTSQDCSELNISAMYHVKKAENIFSRIADTRKNMEVSILANKMAAIAQQIQELTKR